jgi:hypothetical protein
MLTTLRGKGAAMPLHGIVLVLIVYGVGLGVLLLVLMGLSSSGLFSDTSGYVGVTLIPLVLGIAVGAAWMQKRAMRPGPQFTGAQEKSPSKGSYRSARRHT